MAGWKFTADYPQYPALTGSVLGFLEFTAHAVTGTAFTGTLDLTAPPALAFLGRLTGLSGLPLTGTVTDANGTLTVELTSAVLTAGMQALPLIGDRVSGATVTLSVVTNTTDDPEDEPAKNAFTLAVTFTVGSGTMTIATRVPLCDGIASLTGTTSGLGVGLSDLDFLVTGAGGKAGWFPTQQLGPYAAGEPKLELVKVALTVFVKLTPTFAVNFASLMMEVGITNIPLMPNRLYLNPLAVSVTVPGTDAGGVSVALVGDLALCNYQRPGDTKNPDAVLDVQMGLTDYSLSAELEVPEGQKGLAVGTLVSDLTGAATDIGLSTTLTITTFTLHTQADKATGKISSFSTEIAMSGGFGLFADFDLESFDLKLDYTA